MEACQGNSPYAATAKKKFISNQSIKWSGNKMGICGEDKTMRTSVYVSSASAYEKSKDRCKGIPKRIAPSKQKCLNIPNSILAFYF
jgi:hypothetical protein